MLPKKPVTLKLPEKFVQEFIDPLIGTRGFDSRPEVVKEALRKLIDVYQPLEAKK